MVAETGSRRLRGPRVVAGLLLFSVGLPAVVFGLSHDIDISIFPPDKSLLAVDRIMLDAEDLAAGKVSFLINKNLTIEDVHADSGEVRWYSQEDVDPALFIAEPDSDDLALRAHAKGLFITLDDADDFAGRPAGITVTYSGVVYDSVETPSRAYAKGFGTTDGLIDEKGVFLSNETLWYPFAFDRMFTFRLRADVPSDWMSVSQGTMEEEYVAHPHDEDRVVTVWRGDDPTPELYLVAGRYYRHEDRYGRTRVMTYTFEESDSLARVYLDATKRYLALYEGLIGEYPYGKFALVENFWQTGYGMPSFTLLGSKVIRLPFIVHTSYGHEILHNWWGNSVYVDYATGNWCEGLTTYGADYLYKEMAGESEARAYRHETLMAFSNSVTAEKDFPLSDFRERHNASSQSVGYGKSLMVFHMLRRSLGDSVFWNALREFYRNARFTIASWEDLEAAFSDAAGTDLGWYFDQWVKRAGCPTVSIGSAGYREGGQGFIIDVTLNQEAPAFTLDLPLRIETADGVETKTVRLAGTDSTYAIETRAEPRSLAVDPDCDTFRRLYLEEIPVTLGTLFGQDSVVVVIGARESEAAKARFRNIASAWGLGKQIVEENAFEAARMGNRYVWLMGRGDLSDRLLAQVSDRVDFSDGTIKIAGQEFPAAGGTLIVTVRNPLDENLGVGILISDDVEAASLLAMRVPHYSKYSYLGFTGIDQVVKGTWEETQSPLFTELGRR
jgi:aminopeptidase N